ERRQAERRRAAEARAPFWHLQEAEDCLEHNNDPAALSHLRRLGDAALTAPLQARKDRLVWRLTNTPPQEGPRRGAPSCTPRRGPPAGGTGFEVRPAAVISPGRRPVRSRTRGSGAPGRW